MMEMVNRVDVVLSVVIGAMYAVFFTVGALSLGRVISPRGFGLVWAVAAVFLFIVMYRGDRDE